VATKNGQTLITVRHHVSAQGLQGLRANSMAPAYICILIQYIWKVTVATFEQDRLWRTTWASFRNMTVRLILFVMCLYLVITRNIIDQHVY